MDYKLKKKLGGKVHVHYACPSCGQALDSALEEAGQDDECPACRQKFQVPGKAESRVGVSLEQRIELVENQNRRLKWGMTAVSVLAAGAFVLGQAAPDTVPGVIRAKRFEVVNEAGRAVVMLRSWKLGGWIQTRNQQGGNLFVVAATDGGSGMLATYNADGKELVSLSSVKSDDVMNGAGLVSVYDPSGRTRRGMLTTRP